jgi:hypothetical protein
MLAAVCYNVLRTVQRVSKSNSDESTVAIKHDTGIVVRDQGKVNSDDCVAQAALFSGGAGKTNLMWRLGF